MSDTLLVGIIAGAILLSLVAGLFILGRYGDRKWGFIGWVLMAPFMLAIVVNVIVKLGEFWKFLG